MNTGDSLVITERSFIEYKQKKKLHKHEKRIHIDRVLHKRYVHFPVVSFFTQRLLALTVLRFEFINFYNPLLL